MENKFIYTLKDDNANTVALLIFNYELTRGTRIEIQNKINEIKDNIEEYQTGDVIEELHEFYDFEDFYIEYGDFYI